MREERRGKSGGGGEAEGGWEKWGRGGRRGRSEGGGGEVREGER